MPYLNSQKPNAIKTRLSILKFVFLLASVASALITTMASAQQKSRFNLRNVKLVLIDGTNITGELISAAGDSLSISDYSGLAPGTKVSFTLFHVPKQYNGTVAVATDSTITVRLINTPYKLEVVRRTQIESLKVTQRARGPAARLAKTKVYDISSIQSIEIHTKGSMILGFIGGGLTGGLAGFVVILVAGASQSIGLLIIGATLLPVLMVLGAQTGMALAGAGGKFTIDGNQEAFEAFVKKIYR